MSFAAGPSYPLLTCAHCSAEYEAEYAGWCDCDTPKRSLLCPGCRRCLCGAAPDDPLEVRLALPVAVLEALDAAAATPRYARVGHV